MPGAAAAGSANMAAVQTARPTPLLNSRILEIAFPAGNLNRTSMGKGRLECRCPALVCFACVVGGAFSVRAEHSPFPHLWKVPAHSNGATRAVLFAPDGSQLISAGEDGNVRFLRRSDGGLVTNIAAHTGGVCVALSKDGSLLASGGADGLLKIWHGADAALLRSFPGHTSAVASVTFSPDGSLIASGGGLDNQLKIWRVADGQWVRTITGNNRFGMRSVAFSPDGRFVAGSGPEVWLSSDGSLVRTLDDSSAEDVKFSPEGSRITAQQLYTILVYNLMTGRDGLVPSTSHRPLSAFSPDGRSLISITGHEIVWTDFLSRRVITNHCRGFEPCPDWNVYRSIAFDPQGRAVALGTQEGEVVLAELPVWISSIQSAGTNLTIQWEGGTGPFQLQSIRDFTSSLWEDIGPPVTGSTISVPASASAAFYRIRDLSH